MATCQSQPFLAVSLIYRDPMELRSLEVLFQSAGGLDVFVPRFLWRVLRAILFILTSNILKSKLAGKLFLMASGHSTNVALKAPTHICPPSCTKGVWVQIDPTDRTPRRTLEQRQRPIIY
jgi:hypothetical protein